MVRLAVAFWAFLRRWILRFIALGVVLIALAVVTYAVVNPSATPYMRAEEERLDGLRHTWVPIDEIAPVLQRAVVAAEDANFCTHWGFDRAALVAALEDGARRGGSTITQQTVKNVYLWQDRSWLRKGLETLITPMVEIIWPKRRILEVYLNVAEFDTGVFGIEAAAYHHFGVSAANLSPLQSSRLAAVLPNPKGWSAINPGPNLQRRASRIRQGAEVIRQDGRDDCFAD